MAKVGLAKVGFDRIVMECHDDRLCVIVVHAVGTLHLFKGPDDFNGCCTGQANTEKEYVLLCALLHMFVGLKRTRDQKLSSGLMSGSIEFGYHWLDVAHVHDHFTFFSSALQILSNISCATLSIGGQVDVLLD